MSNSVNVDYDEVGKFTALAAAWWDKNGPFKPLHDINPLRLDWIDSICFSALGSTLEGKKVLDVGCGGGILSLSMAQRGASVLGVDMGQENIAVAKLHAQKVGFDARFECVSVEDLAQTHAGSFQIITCMEMLEHVPDPASIVRACCQLLAPSGLLVMSTINKNPKSYLFAIVGAEYVLGLLPKGTHDFGKFITPARLDAMATQAGLKRFDMMGLHYNPLTRRYWLEGDVSVNYMMAFTKADL